MEADVWRQLAEVLAVGCGEENHRWESWASGPSIQFCCIFLIESLSRIGALPYWSGLVMFRDIDYYFIVHRTHHGCRYMYSTHLIMAGLARLLQPLLVLFLSSSSGFVLVVQCQLVCKNKPSLIYTPAWKISAPLVKILLLWKASQVKDELISKSNKAKDETFQNKFGHPVWPVLHYNPFGKHHSSQMLFLASVFQFLFGGFLPILPCERLLVL